MSHTFTQSYAHFVFCTKGRLPSIRGRIESELPMYLAGIIKSVNGIPIMINGTNNHIHILCSMPSQKSTSEMMRLIKTNSSKWINNLSETRYRFEWQTGYGVFSVSRFELEEVTRYIAGQEEHHRRKTFQEEFIELLTAHGMTYEKKYLWG